VGEATVVSLNWKRIVVIEQGLVMHRPARLTPDNIDQRSAPS
jgi:hypothetical protein